METENHPELSRVPRVTLGGTSYEVPLLVPAQQRHVIPASTKLRRFSPNEINQDQYDAIVTIVYHGVRPLREVMTFDQFLMTEVTLSELLLAFPVVMTQTGMMAKTPTGEA